MDIRKLVSTFTIAVSVLLFSVSVNAALITFDDAISGATSYSFDGDGDSIDDVIFSTTDPYGFNTAGPGPNMSYIDEPGLEGSTLINPDLRVDFLVGATDFLRFGFALDDFTETLDTWASFEVYDAGDVLLTSAFELGLYTLPDGSNPSSFPEGIIDVSFAGTAAYAIFDFNNHTSGGQRYIIDNFEGIFGSTEVPEPASILLMGIGLIGLGFSSRAKRREPAS
ncbi:MAG TPA: PEP-CTERM sorting domain-containing protein [Gammaproteobacteria bacterium]|nr:PEP-CTERM sorting domain-containing protein [Gammaproteobacteria bacterium]